MENASLLAKSRSNVAYNSVHGRSMNKHVQNTRKDRSICTHCGLTGNTVDKCYKLLGYPPGLKSKANSGPATNQVFHNVEAINEFPQIPFTQEQ